MATAEKPVLSKYKDRMDKAILALKDEFASLRTGRASASLLDQIQVDAYGSTVPLTQVAAVSVPEPRMITVSVWDKGVAVSDDMDGPLRAGSVVFVKTPDGVTHRDYVTHAWTDNPVREVLVKMAATPALTRIAASNSLPLPPNR